MKTTPSSLCRLWRRVGCRAGCDLPLCGPLVAVRYSAPACALHPRGRLLGGTHRLIQHRRLWGQRRRSAGDQRFECHVRAIGDDRGRREAMRRCMCSGSFTVHTWTSDVMSSGSADECRCHDLQRTVALGYLQSVDLPEHTSGGEAQRRQRPQRGDRSAPTGCGGAKCRSGPQDRGKRGSTGSVGEARQEHPVRVLEPVSVRADRRLRGSSHRC